MTPLELPMRDPDPLLEDEGVGAGAVVVGLTPAPDVVPPTAPVVVKAVPVPESTPVLVISPSEGGFVTPAHTISLSVTNCGSSTPISTAELAPGLIQAWIHASLKARGLKHAISIGVIALGSLVVPRMTALQVGEAASAAARTQFAAILGDFLGQDSGTKACCGED
jgi:hypothetical protein